VLKIPYKYTKRIDWRQFTIEIYFQTNKGIVKDNTIKNEKKSQMFEFEIFDENGDFDYKNIKFNKRDMEHDPPNTPEKVKILKFLLDNRECNCKADFYAKVIMHCAINMLQVYMSKITMDHNTTSLFKFINNM
jgi:hypothetical protein